MADEEKPVIIYRFSNCLNYSYDVNIFYDGRVRIAIQDNTYYETRGGGIFKWGEIYGEKEELELIERNVKSLISFKENHEEKEEYYLVTIRLMEDDGKIFSNSFHSRNDNEGLKRLEGLIEGIIHDENIMYFIKDEGYGDLEDYFG